MAQSGEQIIGEVRWFNHVRGYGFLGQEGGPDVFCHYTAIQSEGYKTLVAGEKVSFKIEQGKQGVQAALVLRYGREAAEQANPLADMN